jgi:hypothetical protein
MFAPNFFELSRFWGLNKDVRSIGKNIPQSYFSVFARVTWRQVKLVFRDSNSS